jgi:gluconate kinase
MGVWDLMGLHQAIKKWEKLAKAEGLSDSDRNFYLQKVEEAKSAYERETNAWEIRAQRYGEDEYGQRSE